MSSTSTSSFCFATLTFSSYDGEYNNNNNNSNCERKALHAYFCRALHFFFRQRDPLIVGPLKSLLVVKVRFVIYINIYLHLNMPKRTLLHWCCCDSWHTVTIWVPTLRDHEPLAFLCFQFCCLFISEKGRTHTRCKQRELYYFVGVQWPQKKLFTSDRTLNT